MRILNEHIQAALAVDEGDKWALDLRDARAAARNLAAELHAVQASGNEVALLREACKAALAWVENMRIVPGGDRDRLRQKLAVALAASSGIESVPDASAMEEAT